ncbi:MULTISPECIES: DUF3408 domain-containing protein [Sphingobacterium]|uniref:DUF3408 domain-containing protein n=1 Tax=Sphingobacterium TaxID=28453 RepID=UPI001D0DA676|nr:DUF3408 domain-containing protein [Sphingobacterium paramultivorum]
MKKQKNQVEVTVKLQQQVAYENVNYESLFLSDIFMDKRGEKSIYVSSEHHTRLSRIARVIGEDKIPLYALLDNILRHHFTLFEEMLVKEFNNKSKPLF